MSSSAMVRVRNLRKAYEIVHVADAPTTAREALVARVRRKRATTTRETFVALDDVSFDVAEGEILGVVGINGAGKSTLLKILSGVTLPDAGSVELFGRTGSLLEVGTGFHPELTGRENVYLNGAILGMSRPFIDRQFDAIVAFAEIEQFLDTPVKRYSSGMYVRLAFSIAAHLEPEILIVDEALAVGDVAFQRKCLEKIHQVSVEHGRTVLFVSHNMHAVETLCDRVLVLERGRLLLDGAVRDGVHAYLQVGEEDLAGRGGADGHWDLRGRVAAVGVERTYIEGVTTLADGVPGPSVDRAQTLTVATRLAGLAEVRAPVLALRISSETGATLFTSLKGLHELVQPGADTAEVELHLPEVVFAPGRYVIDVALLRDGETFVDGVASAAFLSVGHSQYSAAEWERLHGDGRVVVPSEWRVACPDRSADDVPGG